MGRNLILSSNIHINHLNPPTFFVCLLLGSRERININIVIYTQKQLLIEFPQTRRKQQIMVCIGAQIAQGLTKGWLSWNQPSTHTAAQNWLHLDIMSAQMMDRQ